MPRDEPTLASKDRGGKVFKSQQCMQRHRVQYGYLSPAWALLFVQCGWTAMGISVKDRRRLYSGYDEESLSSGQENDKIDPFCAII